MSRTLIPTGAGDTLPACSYAITQVDVLKLLQQQRLLLREQKSCISTLGCVITQLHSFAPRLWPAYAVLQSELLQQSTAESIAAIKGGTDFVELEL